jgi:predicted DNA-binding transcriptional regulator YafY
MERCKTQVERLLEIHRQLQNGEHPNCSTLARQFEVATKTIHRDIDFMKYRLSAPVEYDSRKKGYYYENPTFMLPALSMSEGELTALLLASRTLSEYQGTPVAGKLRDMFTKLSGMLPDAISVAPAELYSQFTVISPPAIPVKPRIWESVVKALLQKRMLEIEYERKPDVYHIKPLHLASLHGDWYLFVQFEGYDNFREIALGRIKRLKLLKKTFEDPGFDKDEFLKGTFRNYSGSKHAYRVKLLFSPTVARRVTEREWHPSQDIIERKNGSVELQFDAKGLVEVKHWILSWGRHCKVLAPKKLKEMVSEEIQSMHKNI